MSGSSSSTQNGGMSFMGGSYNSYDFSAFNGNATNGSQGGLIPLTSSTSTSTSITPTS